MNVARPYTETEKLHLRAGYEALSKAVGAQSFDARLCRLVGEFGMPLVASRIEALSLWHRYTKSEVLALKGAM